MSFDPFSKKMEGNSNSVEWKEIAIMKLLFPSTPFISEWKEIAIKVEGNKGFPNEPDVGYRNFFIPRVEKTSKNEPAGRKSLPPKGRRPAGGELFLPKGLF